jgi:membrane fusion protein, heavy metal efflux system
MNMFMRYIAVMVIGLFWAGCGAREVPEPADDHEGHDLLVLRPAAIAEIGLTTIAAARGGLTDTLRLSAHVVADQDKEARVGTLVPGRVQRVLVKAGDRVAKGDILMTIEGLDVGGIMAGYLKAKAALEYAKAAFDRQKKLFEENVASQRSLLEAQAEHEKALAEFRAEDRRIHSVGLSHDMIAKDNGEEHAPGTLPVFAPIDGIVGERHVVVGQFVDASVTAFVIVNTQTVWVDAQAYEKDLALIAHGMGVTFVADGRPQTPYPGRITFVGMLMDPQTRTVTVRGDFHNPGLLLKPQMFGTLRIPLPGKTDVLIVPQESVIKDGQKEYVFVRRSDTTFERRSVVTGVAAGERIEVRSGLQAGDQVVSKGGFYLKGEMKREDFGGDEH